MSLTQIFQSAVDSLAPVERLRLATMLLETVSPNVLLDDGDEWTDEDVTEYRAAAQRRLATRMELEEEPS